jgi:hypothetical protein
VESLSLNRNLWVLKVEDSASGNFALNVNVHVNGDLLATANREEVKVVNGHLESVTLDVLHEGHVVFAIDHDGKKSVSRTHSKSGFLSRKQHVDWLCTVAVDDSWDLAGAASLAGSTLTEIVANFGIQLGVIRHESSNKNLLVSLPGGWGSSDLEPEKLRRRLLASRF